MVLDISKKIVVRSTVNDFLQQLSPDRFVKTGRSHIVNINHVDSSDNESVEIKNTSLHISKSHQPAFVKPMKERQMHRV